MKEEREALAERDIPLSPPDLILANYAIFIDMRMGHGSRRRHEKRSWEETAPNSVRELASGVGLPSPTWYEGRMLNGYVEKPEEAIPTESSPETEPAPAAEEPGDKTI